MPQAPDLASFWRLLAEGRDAVTYVDDTTLASLGISEAQRSAPDYVKTAYAVDDYEDFAAEFFGYSASEAELIDPQQRVFVELAYEALEDGGYGAGRSHLKVGVFAGCSMSSYLLANLLPAGDVDALTARISNEKDYLVLRVGHKLDLRGPCVSIQTACSTSLVAVASACDSLRDDACDLALAGGITISVHQRTGYQYRKGNLLSPDGRCRAFSAAATGTVAGNGAGVVLLKRLEDAMRDGDHVYAVVRGAAVNNDGAAKMWFTAPSVEGQSAVIREAQARAGVAPDAIAYVECHGTGTPLGDPLEIAALTQVFRERTSGSQFCAIGSVKTNIGHLDCAAGIAGFIKTTLALQHRQIPPSLHFDEPNPAIDFAGTPFFVNTSLRSWESNGRPRLAGVSSFGMGGTNAHVILEEAPPARQFRRGRSFYVLPLSARSETSLAAAFTRLESHAQAHPDLDRADAAFTLACGRAAYAHRRALLCRDADDVLRKLAAGPSSRPPVTGESPLLMLCRGDVRSVTSARAWWDAERAFRDALLDAARALKAAGDGALWANLQVGRWDWPSDTPSSAFAVEVRDGPRMEGMGVHASPPSRGSVWAGSPPP